MRRSVFRNMVVAVVLCSGAFAFSAENDKRFRVRSPAIFTGP